MRQGTPMKTMTPRELLAAMLMLGALQTAQGADTVEFPAICAADLPPFSGNSTDPTTAFSQTTVTTTCSASRTLKNIKQECTVPIPADHPSYSNVCLPGNTKNFSKKPGQVCIVDGDRCNVPGDFFTTDVSLSVRTDNQGLCAARVVCQLIK